MQENVKAISRRLETANEKFLAATVISQPEVRDEEGLPLTEIREELDEDGNVTCMLLQLKSPMKIDQYLQLVLQSCRGTPLLKCLKFYVKRE